MNWKHSAQLLVLTLFITSFSLSLSAQNAYILFDPDCMDRLEYTLQDVTAAGQTYVAYHVNISPTEKIILEIGIESEKPQKFLPAQLIKCNSNYFTKEMVNLINQQMQQNQVFLIRKVGRKRYVMTPVIFASYYERGEEVLTYDSPKYKFQFNKKRGAVGEDINFVDPLAEVFFEGMLEMECTGAYLFRQNAEQNQVLTPHTDLVFVEEIGIIEERLGIDAEDAFNRKMELISINNLPYDEFLTSLCREKEQEPLVLGQSNEEEPSFIPDNFEEKGVRINESPSAPVVLNKGVTLHTVEKGENLYRISKMYGVKVAQIQTWNKMGKSTLIKKGQNLIVSEPGNVPSQVGEETLTSRSGNNVRVQDNRQSNSGQGVEVTPQEQMHRVRRGETVASIALNYGLTEERLRQLNAMTRFQVPRVGEELLVTDTGAPPYWEAKKDTPNLYERGDTRNEALREGNKRIRYKVKEGDTLYSIARAYGTTIQKLMDLNGLEANEILIPEQHIYIN